MLDLFAFYFFFSLCSHSIYPLRTKKTLLELHQTGQYVKEEEFDKKQMTAFQIEEKEKVLQHSQSHLSHKAWTPTAIVQLYGAGIYWYFFFIQFLLVCNVINILLECITLIPHLNHYFSAETSHASQQPTNEISNQFTDWVQTIMITSYEKSEYTLWYISTALNALFFLFQGLFYIKAMQWQSTRYHLEDPREGLYDNTHHNHIAINIIESKSNHSNASQQAAGIQPESLALFDTKRLNIADASKLQRCARPVRQIVSILLFSGSLVLYGFIMYWLQGALQPRLSIDTVSWILSGIQIIVDALWTFVCSQLSTVENHSTESPMYQWLCVRLFVFRMTSYYIFYYVRDIILIDSNNNSDGGGECVLSALGAQGVILSISYICSDLFMDVALPLIYNRCNKGKGMRSAKSNAESMYEFNIAEHLCARLFRQFLLSEGNSYIPGLSVFALIGHAAQYFVDRWKLQSKRTHLYKPVAHVFTHLIIALLLLIFFANIFGYPKGLFWFWYRSNSFNSCDFLKV